MRPWHLFLPLLLIHQLIEFMAWTGVVDSDFGFLFLTLFLVGFRSWVGSSYCQAGVLCFLLFFYFVLFTFHFCIGDELGS